MLTTELWLPRSRSELFPFFADARNLEAITPSWLSFSVLTPLPIAMRAGTRIDYRLRIHGIPLHWLSEITDWRPPCSFVDEQRRGPYRHWRHTHTFAENGGGTLCRDFVEYAPRGGWLMNSLFVRRDLSRIFAFRHEALRRLFPANPAPSPALMAAETR